MHLCNLAGDAQGLPRHVPATEADHLEKTTLSSKIEAFLTSQLRLDERLPRRGGAEGGQCTCSTV